LASRRGFEPLAYGLGNRCSILLSYRDVFEMVTLFRFDFQLSSNSFAYRARVRAAFIFRMAAFA
jgi:hypothetical protein